jgi:hypothetical protein
MVPEWKLIRDLKNYYIAASGSRISVINQRRWILLK